MGDEKTATLQRLSNAALALIVVLIFVGLVSAVVALPPAAPGLSDAVDAELARSGMHNPVTTTLLDFRSFDTLLEIAVLLAAVPTNGSAKSYRVESIEVQATVREDGSLVVEEAIRYRFTGRFRFANRDIPLKPGEQLTGFRMREAGTEYDILVYGELDTLVHTESGLTGTTWTYLEATEIAESGLGRLNDHLRVVIQTYGASRTHEAIREIEWASDRV